MRDDLSRNIIVNQYGARVQEGYYKWRDSIPAYPSYFNTSIDDVRSLDSHLHVVEVRSVQLDLHPADFKRLSDDLEYLHDYRQPQTASQLMQQRQNPSTGYAEHLYKKQWREEELRKRHPLLQDLWQQYQMTLNLITSGEYKDNE